MIECPDCGSMNVIKKGSELNRYGRVRKYKCKDCARNFIGTMEEEKQEEI